MNKVLIYIAIVTIVALFSSCEKCIPTILCPYVNPHFFSVTGSDTASLNLPNAFTPNGDGINDVFYLFSRNIASFQCKIFDASGRQIFMSNDKFTGWDGTLNGKRAPVGLYAVKATAITTFGTPVNLNGTVSIIGGQFKGDNSQNVDGNMYLETKNMQLPDECGYNGLFDPYLPSGEYLLTEHVNNCH
jgi:gliding motility-associated-like protein